MAVSEANLQAPEEVFDKRKGRKGVLQGESELSQEDRKRKRQVRNTIHNCWYIHNYLHRTQLPYTTTIATKSTLHRNSIYTTIATVSHCAFCRLLSLRRTRPRAVSSSARRPMIRNSFTNSTQVSLGSSPHILSP
jgi:hypothetical protein